MWSWLNIPFTVDCRSVQLVCFINSSHAQCVITCFSGNGPCITLRCINEEKVFFCNVFVKKKKEKKRSYYFIFQVFLKNMFLTLCHLHFKLTFYRFDEIVVFGVFLITSQTQMWSKVVRWRHGPLYHGIWATILDIVTLNAYTFFMAQYCEYMSGITTAQWLLHNKFSKELVTPYT